MVNSRKITDLRSDVQSACNEVIARAKAQGINIIITSTVRDDAYQNKLYQQGRTAKGSIVTCLQKPTFHWNKAGLAFDFCPVDANGNCLWGRTDLFAQVGKIGESIGLEWGGDWRGFVDKPHLQWSGYNHEYDANMVRALKLPPLWVNKTITVTQANTTYCASFGGVSTEGECKSILAWVQSHAKYIGKITQCGGTFTVSFGDISTKGECESILAWVHEYAKYIGKIEGKNNE